MLREVHMARPGGRGSHTLHIYLHRPMELDIDLTPCAECGKLGLYGVCSICYMEESLERRKDERKNTHLNSHPNPILARTVYVPPLVKTDGVVRLPPVEE